MAISLTKDFKTVQDLQQDADTILAQLQNAGRPLFVTQGGKPAAVLLSVEVFERLVHTLNLSKLLAEAQEDLHAGRTQPLDDWMKEFERANNLPSRTRRQRQA